MNSVPRPANPGPPAPSLRVDLTSPTPPYEQLRQQIAGLIATGDLRRGDRLPPVRQLAADLGLAVGTVVRAYRELEEAGLIEGRGRHGTRVRPGTGATARERSRQRALSEAAGRFAATARALGATDDATLTAVRTALARHTAQQT